MIQTDDRERCIYPAQASRVKVATGRGTRGLLHSFRDAREAMVSLFRDLDLPDMSSWEICFELRIKRAKWIRIYADVLVMAGESIFRSR